ncbi:MAG: Smr/MutS family protein [Bacilli bacterium]|jgi:DNA mismatch repair protein MutS2|nr:Smr/MutS family protein [Bacilli bacterium]
MNNSFYPTLDVHGETRDTVVYPVKSFIQDNLKLQKKRIVIIHGRGEGILKKQVHEILKKHPKVLNYYIDGMNLGATMVELKIAKFDK